MRWATLTGVALALALAPAACKQTIVIDQTAGDGGGVSDGGPGLPVCTGSLELTPESPEVIVALDRSTGMTTARLSDTTAFTAASTTLDQFVGVYQKVVSFGYVEFPAQSTAFNQCTGGPQQQSCCASPLSPPSLNSTLFENALHTCDAGSPVSYCAVGSMQRPIVPALAACWTTFMSRTHRSDRDVLLITNGGPDCGTNPNSACNDAVTLVNQLYNNAKARVHVFAPGQIDSFAMDCLGQIASQGGATSAPYYHPATTSADLSDDIGGVMRTIAMGACHLDLPQSARGLQSPDGLTLVWKDLQIPYDRNNGWDLPGNGSGFSIDLNGEACNRWIVDGQGTFTLYTGCAPPHH
jgi:hypothetical protein